MKNAFKRMKYYSIFTPSLYSCGLFIEDNNLLITFYAGEFQVTSRPTNSIDYFETDLDDDDGSGSGFSNDNSSLARIVKIATAILGVLLIIVLCAILCK